LVTLLCLGTTSLVGCTNDGNDPPPSSVARPPSTGGGASNPTKPSAPTGPVTLEPPAMSSGTDAGTPRTDIVVRVSQKTAASSTESSASTAPVGTRTLFLNRNGGTYYPGADNSSNNTSSIISSAVNAPPWSRSDADWTALVAGAKAAYAPYNVFVTDQDPGAAPHVEVVVSGSPTMIGEPSWTAGISPMAQEGSVIERAICWVFDTQLQGTDDQVRVVTHEAAHAYGLDHEFYCPDTMSYLFDCGDDKSFQDSNQYCGEYSARGCASGQSAQDSVQALLASLGPTTGMQPPPSGGDDAGTRPPPTPTDDAGSGSTGTSPATITLLSPDDGTAATGNTNLNVSAKVDGAQRVVLEWELNGGLQSYDCAAMPTGSSCSQSGDQFTWTLNVGTGPRTWYVQATDASGNVTTSSTRSLTLSDATSSGGSIDFTSPSAGQAFNAGDSVSITVDTGSTAGVAIVWLTWTAPTAQVQYPLTYLGGTTWGLTVTTDASSAVSGERDLAVTAYDSANDVLAQSTSSIQIQ
jgi:hypothetical protein